MSGTIRSLAVVAALLLGAAPPGEPPRVPWTTSRFAGTPDPPLPYTVEPAFPKLALDRPVALDQPPDSNRLFVAELGGRLVSFANDPAVTTADVALNLATAHPAFGQVFGLAFHPQFLANRQVFICYTVRGRHADGTRVSRFILSRTEPPRIDAAGEEIVLTYPEGGHNGGCLAFGPDGFLYVSTGDATEPSPPDSLDTGQNVGDLLGSILRIDVDHRDGNHAYRVPRDNPFVNLPGARPEVWAYGLRNPWRMSFDRKRGDLWVGDVGWELWELIHRVERGGNYGWSVMEGHQVVRPDARRGPTPIVPPIAVHPHSEAASITGGYVYHGTRLKDLSNVYLYGDYQSGKVWGLRYDGQRVVWQRELADTGLRIVSFGEDRAGEVYLLELERSNQVYRLVPNARADRPSTFPRTLSASGLFGSTHTFEPAPGVMAYAINAEPWADGARAERLLAIPGTARATVDRQGNWKLPEGSVLARTVTLDQVEGDRASRRRIETQVLHLEAGSWRPYTYRWNDEQTDAELVVAEGSSRAVTIRDPAAPGGRREHVARFAARAECVLCHNPWVEARTTVFGRQSASPLGLTDMQLDRGDQLRRLAPVAERTESRPARRLVDPYDESADGNMRARAYLEVNCAHCHQFNAGGAATIVLASALDLAKTNTIEARPTQGTFGIDDARIIAPGAPERSVLLYRIAKTGAGRMPRVGSQRVDDRGVRLIADWIAQMPTTAAGDSGVRAALAQVLDPAAAQSTRRDALGRLIGSTRGALALVCAIDRGDASPELARETARRARELPGAEVRDLFERFLPESERVQRLGATIDADALLALSGDPARGRRWFFADSAGRCHTCHKVGGQGTELGPPLDAIGSKYSDRRELLRQILEPSRLIDPKFATRTLATADGQIKTGLLVERNAREVVLRDARNETLRVKADDVAQEAALATSLMPDGLLADLTAQQAADLLAFLATLKGK